MTVATSSWTGQPRVKGSTQSIRLFLLTLSLIGLQFCWGTEQTYATPYLLQLGLSKGKMSLVWIAGPLSGLIMQPIIGMISDKSNSRYGRRRPFMVGGTVAVAFCLLVLGWAKEIVGAFVPEAEQERRREWTVILAIADIYVLDFVINIAQATCRALVVDTLPVSQQQLGAAWVARMIGIGHMLVFGLGALDLNTILPPLFGDTQFKKVCSIAALMMVLSQFTTCWAVTERVLVSDGKSSGTDESLWSMIKQIYERALFVPERIQAICNVQFWSWIGWFPLMFYGSTWVGEIYLRHEAPSATEDVLTQVGRVGSTGLIVHSTIGFITSIVLPWMVTSPGQEEQPGFTPRPPESLKSVVGIAKGAQKPSLLNVWTAGCAMFAVFMCWAPAVQSVRFAIFLMAATGIPSAIAGLAAGTFIGVEVNRLSSSLPLVRGRSTSGHRLSNEYELDNTNSPTTLHVRHSSASSLGTSSTGELSGIYLGILNIYTTLPQFVGTAISWVVFSILEPGKSPELAKDADPDEHHSTEGLSGIGVCLFIGAVSSVIAAKATRRLRDDR